MPQTWECINLEVCRILVSTPVRSGCAGHLPEDLHLDLSDGLVTMPIVYLTIDDSRLIHWHSVLLERAFDARHALLHEKHRLNVFLNGHGLIVFNFLARFSDYNPALGDYRLQSRLRGVDGLFHPRGQLVLDRELGVLWPEIHQGGGHLGWDREGEGEGVLAWEGFTPWEGQDNGARDEDHVFTSVV